ncbi:MAG: SDR family oxidoreductase [Solirubrobacteraceae bacterium]|nr:SDR family oxidoreductase [Solirubrobacteraceae bacterium]
MPHAGGLSDRADIPDGALLLTGATGFLGMQILARVLDQSDRHVVALIRADDDVAARERLRKSLGMILTGPIPEHRLTAIAADLESPALDLDGDTHALLADRVTTILHCAASISFVLPLDESRQINVDGTRRMVELARRCARTESGLDRFAYVSTAYVAGRHRGAFGPDDLETGQQFRNGYERSKNEAEVLVRQAASDELRVQIFRPSIVVGERETGWTTSFNVLYAPYRSYAAGQYTVLPGRLDGIIDVVPVDYVADGIWALMGEPLKHAVSAHMLVAGEYAPTMREIRETAVRYFEKGTPTIVHPTAFRLLAAPAMGLLGGAKARSVIARSKPFFPYFAVETEYDARSTQAALRRHGIAPPEFDDYSDRLLDFAVRAKWGKRIPPRHEVAGEVAVQAA